MIKFLIIKLEQHSMTSSSYAVTYYQSLEEIPLLLRLEKPKNDKISKKLKKMQVLKKKLLEVVILKSWKLFHR